MSDAAPPGRVAFVGCYPPRRCGIATFTYDLCEAVGTAAPSAHCLVAAVNDRVEGYDYPDRVRFEILEKDLHSYRRAADSLNFSNTDILCVQHEFGIYGGPAGSHLLSLLKEVRMPEGVEREGYVPNVGPCPRPISRSTNPSTPNSFFHHTQSPANPIP